MNAWVNLLVLAAAGDHGLVNAITVGRGGNQRAATRSVLAAPENPLEILLQLVDLLDRGLRGPIPMWVNTTAEYAKRRFAGQSIDNAMSSAEATWGRQFSDGDDPSNVYVFGESSSFADLAATAPLDDECVWAEEPTRFGVLANRLWLPVLLNESAE